MTQTNLKPCPRCGGPAVFYRRESSTMCADHNCRVTVPADPTGAKWNALPRRGDRCGGCKGESRWYANADRTELREYPSGRRYVECAGNEVLPCCEEAEAVRRCYAVIPADEARALIAQWQQAKKPSNPVDGADQRSETRCMMDTTKLDKAAVDGLERHRLQREGTGTITLFLWDFDRIFAAARERDALAEQLRNCGLIEDEEV
jgi:hypothetical protein